jgi:hypothetical protein
MRSLIILFITGFIISMIVFTPQTLGANRNCCNYYKQLSIDQSATITTDRSKKSYSPTFELKPTSYRSIFTTPDNKISLWNRGVTLLRGANIYQRRVYPEYDDGYIGNGQFGPPFTQKEFYALSALGANYVNLSTHGVFSEKLPYVVNPAAVANMDLMISRIEKADMFVVISIRTGPGGMNWLSLVRKGLTMSLLNGPVLQKTTLSSCPLKLRTNGRTCGLISQTDIKTVRP